MRKQKSVSDLGFTRYDWKRLQKRIEQVEDKRTYIRLRIVQLIAEGKVISEIAGLWDVTPQVIYHWIKIYVARHQPLDLSDKPKTGCPKAAAKITDNRILNVLSRNPMQLGYRVNTWTVATLAHRLSSLYCPITARTLYRRMTAMGLECKRPKYFYEEKDPNRAQKKGPLSES